MELSCLYFTAIDFSRGIFRNANVAYVLVWRAGRVAKIKQIHGKPQQTERSFHTQSFRSCSALPGLAVHVGCLYFVTHIIRKLIADLEAYRISQHSQIVSLRNMKIKETCTELLLKGQHGSQSLPH